MKYLAYILLVMQVSTVWAADKVAVRQDELRRVVESYITSRAAGSGVQIEVKRLTGLADMVVTPGNITYEVLAPQQWDGLGKASMALIIRVDDQVVRNLPVQAEVEGWREVLVAARPFERGDILQKEDVTIQRRNMALVRGTPLLTIGDATGKRVKSAIKQGAVLSGNQLEKIMLVTVGQQVTIILESDAMQLTAIGRAKGAGALGDLIQVQNSASLKEFPARVVNAKTVQVDF